MVRDPTERVLVAHALRRAELAKAVPVFDFLGGVLDKRVLELIGMRCQSAKEVGAKVHESHDAFIAHTHPAQPALIGLDHPFQIGNRPIDPAGLVTQLSAINDQLGRDQGAALFDQRIQRLKGLLIIPLAPQDSVVLRRLAGRACGRGKGAKRHKHGNNRLGKGSSQQHPNAKPLGDDGFGPHNHAPKRGQTSSMEAFPPGQIHYTTRFSMFS